MPIPKKTKTVSAYFTEDDTEQIRAAVQAVGKIEGYPSITALVEAATLRELHRLQRKHNGGRKWAGVPSGELRPGQRNREEMRSASRPDYSFSISRSTAWQSREMRVAGRRPEA